MSQNPLAMAYQDMRGVAASSPRDPKPGTERSAHVSNSPGVRRDHRTLRVYVHDR
jgi:hypothetical protein